jgi:hypothetical protein
VRPRKMVRAPAAFPSAWRRDGLISLPTPLQRRCRPWRHSLKGRRWRVGEEAGRRPWRSKTVTVRTWSSTPAAPGSSLPSILLSPPRPLFSSGGQGQNPQGGGGQGDEDGGLIYRAVLGFRANGWTAGDPWHSCPRARGAHPARKVGDVGHGRCGTLPHGARHASHGMEDREERRDGERADWWAPHGSETRRWVGGRRAGWLVEVG